ncbi:hypothetical protein DPM19_32880 [Actinomadura craniellae]|uniref:DUF732 domain-containing protein n=1 Tax=Actinomadura craniellae TaxID=2231787 RepID=A0A365GVY2_9ACTN|nr:hypothetical protein [Actinomadura craniellae]RAY10934.1 hypothetical protein DPM19_32880 [Actinomadura craniellae]
MIKNIATSLAAASLGVVLLGTAACGGDDTSAAPPTATPSAGGSPTGAAPTPAASPPGAGPASSPDPRPRVTGSQVIMIDPEGKRYTRKQMVELAAGMAAAFEGRGLPPNFCEVSYQQGVDEGGQFPAGKAAFMEACQEGLRLAG